MNKKDKIKAIQNKSNMRNNIDMSMTNGDPSDSLTKSLKEFAKKVANDEKYWSID